MSEAEAAAAAAEDGRTATGRAISEYASSGPAESGPAVPARYARQLALLGASGQEALRRATVLVAGIGGLGGTAALYLAAAGIGRLILAHEGVIAEPDLNRQILMDTAHLGLERMETAVSHLRRLNPEVEIEGYNARITEDQSRSWVESADIVIDARYDFPERYILNRLCVQSRTPMIEAAMYGFEISLTTVVPGETPCLECLYPQEMPSWEPLGFPVLGATSGMAGCLAALEAVKWITRVGTTYMNVMHRFHSLDFTSYSVRLTRNPNCACCVEGG
ncbi:HesA/MoeB/ThiF family protein [Paenibacillus spiritus]|uniref:HesA/MoeB/ThiF family protein n=1 Tax=Paenibacillus spiritus TaxID=2496557 RepID=A0A5J5G0X1_9BACL|nr:HesA/MoeB/ThiF family protein [Paenibacillus spiritus]KAA9000348.1 HesA/MoeB/ThiF family protein [Paenibacillus spiritus]